MKNYLNSTPFLPPKFPQLIVGYIGTYFSDREIEWDRAVSKTVEQMLSKRAKKGKSNLVAFKINRPPFGPNWPKLWPFFC